MKPNTFSASFSGSVVSRISMSRSWETVSQDLLMEIRDTTDPEKLAEKVFGFIDSDLAYWSKVGAFPLPIQTDRFNKGFGSPAFPKIKQYFNRFGYATYARDLSDRLRAAYMPTVNMVN